MKLSISRKIILLNLLLLSLGFAPAASSDLGTNTITNGGFLLLRFWQKVISPIDGPRCAFRPTCSEYARLAVRKYGIIKGTIMGSERLQRCNMCHNYEAYYYVSGNYYLDPVENNVY